MHQVLIGEKCTEKSIHFLKSTKFSTELNLGAKFSWYFVCTISLALVSTRLIRSVFGIPQKLYLSKYCTFEVLLHACLRRRKAIVPSWNIKVFISGPCPILVLTTVLGHPRRTYAKSGVENIRANYFARKCDSKAPKLTSYFLFF